MYRNNRKGIHLRDNFGGQAIPLHKNTMSFSIGIVGLPNVGKSTLFKALTKIKVDANNYPFCTIDPNVGVVKVPDERLPTISEISASAKTLYTTIEFVDIAGLVKGAHQGEGLGNKFLSNIRNVDAICQVIRNFKDDDIVHVDGKIDPESDRETINLELILADLQSVEKRLSTTQKQARGKAAPEILTELALLEKLHQHLADGKLASSLELTPDEAKLIKQLDLLTMKPMLYVVNIDENDITNPNNPLPDLKDSVIFISAKIEAELSELDDNERQSYMQDLGMSETGLDTLIKTSYSLLDLITFITSGEPETRAWTIPRHTKAPQAAAVIHSDFEKLFIRAEVVTADNFITHNGWSGCRDQGLIRVEGKNYVIQDGDVCYFKIGN